MEHCLSSPCRLFPLSRQHSAPTAGVFLAVSCASPARMQTARRGDGLPVHPDADRGEEQPQNTLTSSCYRGGSSPEPRSCIQAQSCSLLILGIDSPKLTSQHRVAQAGTSAVAPHSPMSLHRCGGSCWRNLHPKPALLSSRFSLAAHAWELHILFSECQAAPSPGCVQGLACK